MDTPKRRPRFRALKLIAAIVGSLIGLVILAVVGVTLWLTPSRLSAIVSERGSEYLDADLRVSNLRFTIWSSFPRLCLVADSVSVTSRTLDSVPESIKTQLPPDASRLGGCGSFSGAVNVASLLKGEIRLHDVKIDRFNLNLLAVNDSLSNYDIFPSTPDTKTKIPRLSANSISLTHPGVISYQSLESGLNGVVRLHEISLKELGDEGEKKNSYDLDLSGKVKAVVDSLPILDDFPFTLDGIVNLRFSPFGISFKNYSIALGNIRSRASMNFEAGASPKINNFSFDIRSFHLMKLLGYLPPEILPRIEGLDADVLVNASARLTKPYHFSSSALPSVEVTFSVPDGDVVYTAGEGGRYSARHIGLKGIFMFNGDDPKSSYISIPGFSVEGEGMDLDLSARVDNLLGSPKVHATADVSSQIENLKRYFAMLAPFYPAGDVNLMTTIDFTLPSYNSSELENVAINGSVDMTDTRFRIPQVGATARARNTSVSFSSRMATLNTSTTNFPVDIKGTMKGIEMSMGHDSTRLQARDLTFSGRVSGTGPTDRPDSLSLTVGSRMFKAMRPGLEFTLKDFATSVDLAPGKYSIKRPAPLVFKDQAMLDRIPHTPVILGFASSDSLRRFLAGTCLHGDMKLAGGVLKLKNYPAPVILNDCAIRWSLDSVAIDRFSFRSQESALTLSGGVSNLRQYLSWPERSVLKARLKADIDTLNINQLARAYETAVKAAGLGRSRADSIAEAARRAEAYARQDTTALILPRNVDLSVEARGKEVIYTNLFFEKVKTRLTMADGIFRLGDLEMQASFAGAKVNLIYDTSDIENIACYGDLGILDLDLVKMYAKFPSIPRMAPEVVNLSGILSLNADLNLGIFPTMTADVPGFHARVGLNGRNLKLHQTEFIHHIARMMMIFSHEDIHIADINIAGNVHDNLLELYPFNLDFSRYRLKLEGLNNFAGDLYYHIGVDHSPIPFRFGIEVEGQYHHPKLRFCGSGWNSDKAGDITAHVMESGSFNFVSYARKGMKAFVHEAAKSPVTSSPKK